MEKILLVEQEYTNKYPQLGLMKIATYHKSKGDKVEFYKGKAPYTIISRVDRVYITTLFTFYYDITVSTIKHYLNYLNSDQIYVGGIASTLLNKDFKRDTGLKNIITGQLTNSSIIGYTDNVDIDELPLDYDILDDISYRYPAGDNFFVYTTRGCPRKCEFCAVSILEPKFQETNHMIKQIDVIREKYGDKRNVLIMDNNILFSDNLKQIADDLISMGFERNNPNYIYPNPLELLINKIQRRKQNGINFLKQEEELVRFLLDFKHRVKSQIKTKQYQDVLNEINNSTDKYGTIILHKEELVKIIETYRFKKPLQRFVDFNQGVDARLLSEEKMIFLRNIPIKPFRLAYDNISDTEIYNNAFGIAYKHGVRYFSNYILYNYKDKPEDLWNRLYNNIILYEKKKDLHAFSFPMKFTPIGQTDRDFVGTYWEKKYLSAINVILNVTKGVVAKEKPFFFKAYGKDVQEFIMILTMPDEFIRYRLFFEKNGYINAWKKQYSNLDINERKCLINILSGKSVQQSEINEKVLKILEFYKVTKYIASNQC